MKSLEKFVIEAAVTFTILLGIFVVGAIVYATTQLVIGNVPQTVCLGY
jgi:uncharacterized membrane protein